MAFAAPQNFPAAGDMQRRYEDSQWEKSGGQGFADHGAFDSATRRFSSIFGANEELPLYKDKPYRGRPTKKLSKPPLRLLILLALTLFIGIYWIGVFLRPSASASLQKKPLPAWLSYLRSSSFIDWEERQEMVKSAFARDWETYSRDGWGYDQFNPISKSRQNIARDGVGWIITNGLDTLILMNMTSELQEARNWLSNSLNFDKNQKVSSFGVGSRILGGLLSAHYLSTTFPDMAPISLSEDDEDLYLEKASDLVDRLLNAFDSPSGLPNKSFDLMNDGSTPPNAEKGNITLAEATGLQLELRYLSKLTGEKLFWDRAEKVMQVIDRAGINSSLLPTLLSPETGKFQNNHIKVGYGSELYYKNVLQQYLQTSQQEPIYIGMWNQAFDEMREHLITYSSPSNLTVIAERPSGLGGAISSVMDSSACVLPGLLALGVTQGASVLQAKEVKGWGPRQETDMDHARRIMNTCWAMCKSSLSKLPAQTTEFDIYTPPKMIKDFAVLPSLDGIRDEDDADWRQDLIGDTVNEHTPMSPQIAESLLYLWRITSDEKYRQWGWELFEAHMKFASYRAVRSYESPSSASNAGGFQSDLMDNFLPAEAFKYLYLLFGSNDILPLQRVVFSSKGHVFPRFELGKLFSTGWKLSGK